MQAQEQEKYLTSSKPVNEMMKSEGADDNFVGDAKVEVFI